MSGNICVTPMPSKIKSLLAVGFLLAAFAFFSRCLGIMVAFNFCCRDAPPWGLLAFPVSGQDFFSLLVALAMLWLPSLLLFLFLKYTFSIRSKMTTIVVLAVSMIAPTMVHWISVAGSEYYSEWGGEVMYSNGRPTIVEITRTAVNILSMWVLTSIAVIVVKTRQLPLREDSDTYNKSSR